MLFSMVKGFFPYIFLEKTPSMLVVDKGGKGLLETIDGQGSGSATDAGSWKNWLALPGRLWRLHLSVTYNSLWNSRCCLPPLALAPWFDFAAQTQQAKQSANCAVQRASGETACHAAVQQRTDGLTFAGRQLIH